MEHSAYPHIANKTNFVFSDDTSKKTTYNINSQGFRGKEFENIDVITLGCSITFGVGLHESDAWPNVLGNLINKNVANLSKAGASADTCFRFASHWIPKLKPQIVIYLQPPQGRFEILRKDLNQRNQGHFSVNRKNYSHEEYITFKSWHNNPLNNDLNYQKNSLAIEQLCAKHNAKFLMYDSADWDLTDNTAFDNKHPGVQQHKAFANFIVDSESL